MINNHLGQLYLPTPVLAEIEEITEVGCIQLGIKLIEPNIEQVEQASQERGALSFQDNLCLILAREHGWTIVTNDKALRRKCEKEGIPLIWGIELICMLVESGGLPAGQARDIILKIQEINPKFITEGIVQDAFNIFAAGFLRLQSGEECGFLSFQIIFSHRIFPERLSRRTFDMVNWPMRFLRASIMPTRGVFSVGSPHTQPR